MSDVCKSELQRVIDNLCKYLKNNRNHIAQELYKDMHRDDYLGNFGHIYAHNDTYDIDIKIQRKRR